MGNWWIVMLPGEDADMSDFYGPFRSEVAAQEAADKWNRNNNNSDEAQVKPIAPARGLASAR